ncbi:MAG: hypothetical protein ABEH43_08530, partial [Flavobacteriales bacterium]
NNKRRSDDKMQKNEEFRHLSNLSPIPRFTYEITREGWSRFEKDFKKKIENFALEILKTSEPIGKWKKFAVNFFRERGKSDEWISDRLFMADYKRGNGMVLKGEYLEKRILTESKNWSENYPKWPVDESKVHDDKSKTSDSNSSRNSQGKGSEQRRNNPPKHKNRK